jgi:pimeloyl-ACP methyl ester carboxylesterase
VLRSFGDSNLFGESFGEGTARVVWLHGWARRADDFTVAAAALADRGVASVALDLPGFGSSPLPTVAGGARLYAELLLPALAAITDEPLVLVGHSFGGTVATVVASTHPERVRALVLVAAPLIRRAATSKAPLAYRARKWLHAKGLLSDARIEAVRQKYGSTDYRRAHGLLRHVLVASVNESYESELATLSMPVDFVWGEHDTDVPLDVAERAALLLRGDHNLRVVPGVGHLLPLEAPDELVDAVERLLAR